MLIVEDSADVRESLRPILQHQGYVVEGVADGETGLERVRTFEPNTVLIDLGLPGLNGLELARAIRALPKGEAIHLTAVTGYGCRPDDVALAHAHGFDHHLVKPIEVSQLLGMLAAPPAAGSEPRTAGP